MHYIRELFLVLFRHKLYWWVSLAIAVYLGVGFGADYPIIRTWLSSIGLNAPHEIAIAWIAFLFLFWLSASLVHKETLRSLRAGRIVIEDPAILNSVPLYKYVMMNSGGGARLQVGENDILYMIIRNKPYDMSNSREIKFAYCSVLVESLIDGKEIIQFDYPRWEDNPKPGYDGNPQDHYLDEWRFRTLNPNGCPNRVDLIVKSRNEENAFGFRGRSQLKPKWHDEELTIPPGRYRIMFSISGYGMREPYLASYEFINNGAGKDMQIRRTDRGLTTQWVPENTSV